MLMSIRQCIVRQKAVAEVTVSSSLGAPGLSDLHEDVGGWTPHSIVLNDLFACRVRYTLSELNLLSPGPCAQLQRAGL